jgi:hypothetical protein
MNETQKLIQQHIEKFGKQPNIIGRYWRNREKLNQNLRDAIESGEPYDEYEMMSDDMKRAYDDGELDF